MKKFSIIFLILVLSLCACLFCGCEKQDDLEKYISELRTTVYEGESQNYKLSANYGFREYSLINDGKVGNKTYFLTFKLLDRQLDQQTYYLQWDFEGKQFNQEFKLSPSLHVLCLELEIENLSASSLEVNVGTLDKKEKVVLQNAIPKGTLTYKQALKSLHEKQGDLVNSYYDQKGNFTAEIYQRIIVKEGKAYWYIGFASGNGRLKALLIDGKNGSVLAVREIF